MIKRFNSNQQDYLKKRTLLDLKTDNLDSLVSVPEEEKASSHTPGKSHSFHNRNSTTSKNSNS